MVEVRIYYKDGTTERFDGDRAYYVYRWYIIARKGNNEREEPVHLINTDCIKKVYVITNDEDEK